MAALVKGQCSMADRIMYIELFEVCVLRRFLGVFGENLQFIASRVDRI